jgi:mRNA-degrading endonuclease RelE of RelBE toxin-antitoxin system
VARRIHLSPDAVREFRRFRARDRSVLRDAMTEQLERSDATMPTRNRYRLRRPSGFADYELRVENWRIFYRVEGTNVYVALIGRKRGNALIVGGRRFVL